MSGLLHLALEEGVDGDLVVVSLDGREVERRAGLTTRPQIGLADSVELPVESERVALGISVPGRSLERTVEVAAADPVYVGVSIERGELSIRVQREPFGYV